MAGGLSWILLTAIVFCTFNSYCSAGAHTRRQPFPSHHHSKGSILNYGPLVPWGDIHGSTEECMKAMRLLKGQRDQEFNDILGGPLCGALWDGVLCWPATSAGERVYQSCPSMPGLDPEKFAERACGIDGKWVGEEKVGSTGQSGWTDYRPCYTPYALALYQATYGDL